MGRDCGGGDDECFDCGGAGETGFAVGFSKVALCVSSTFLAVVMLFVVGVLDGRAVGGDGCC